MFSISRCVGSSAVTTLRVFATVTDNLSLTSAYLHHLATTGVLQETAFLEYLKYLQYWKKPEYVKYLSYPHCLYFLELLLENSTFRRELGNIPFRDFVHSQQFYSWQHRARRLYGEGLAKEEEGESSAMKIDENIDEGTKSQT